MTLNTSPGEPAQGSHASQGGDTGAQAPDPARQDSFNYETLVEKLAPRLNQIVQSHLKRNAPESKKTTSTTTSGDDGDDEATPPKSDPRADKRVKALETELAAMKADREKDKLESQKIAREQALRRAAEAADPLSIDDFFHVLRGSSELKVSDDGQFIVEGKDGLEVPLGEWAKKQLAARPYLMKPTPKDGGGSVRGGANAAGKYDPSLTGAALLDAYRAKNG